MPAGLGNVSTFFFSSLFPTFYSGYFFSPVHRYMKKYAQEKQQKGTQYRLEEGRTKLPRPSTSQQFCFVSNPPRKVFLFFVFSAFDFFLPHVQGAPCASFRE